MALRASGATIAASTAEALAVVWCSRWTGPAKRPCSTLLPGHRMEPSRP
jgi:hypothetical protein